MDALGAHRRDEVGGVAEEVEPAVAHRLVHDTAQRHDPLVDDLAGGHGDAEAGLQFVPDTGVRPLLGGVVHGALQVDAARVRAAGQDAGEAERVDRHAGRIGRHRGQDAEPGVAVRVGVLGQRGGGDGTPAHAPETVAAGDEVALDGLGRAVGTAVADERTLAGDVLQGHVGGFVAQVSAVAQEHVREVADQDLLRTEETVVAVIVVVHVDRHRLPVDVEDAPAVRDGVTGQHFLKAPGAEHAHPEGVDGPGPLPLFDVGAGVLLQDDAVDAVAQQEVAEGQAGDACPDDDDGRVFAGLRHVCASLRAQSGCRSRRGRGARVARRAAPTLGSTVTCEPPGGRGHLLGVIAPCAAPPDSGPASGR